MQELLVDHLDLLAVTFFGQDWGGLIGLRLVAENPQRFDRVIVGNTGLPIGEGQLSEAFAMWQEFSQSTPVFDVGALINGGTTRDLTQAEIDAYDAPFPDDSYKAGARIFPALVPTRPDDPAIAANMAAWEVLRSWEKPFITCFSDKDPITGGGEKVFQKLVPGAQGQPHVTVTDAHHFLQEDASPRLCQIILEAVAAS